MLQQARKYFKHYAITDQKRTGYNAIHTKTKKLVAKAMRMGAKKVIEAFSESPKKNF